MDIQILYPIPELRNVIHHYEAIELKQDEVDYSSVYGYPNFATGFVFFFHLEGPIKAGSKVLRETDLYPDHFIAPITTQLYNRYEHQSFGCLRVIFQPGAIYALFGLSLGGLKDHRLSLSEMFGKELYHLHEQITEAGNTSARIQAIENFILQNGSPNFEYHHFLNAVHQNISKHGSSLKTDTLANELGISTRQLHRKIKNYTGYSSKEFLKIYRFCKVKQLMHEGFYRNLTHLAHGMGYFDQAHFIREFKGLTQQTPLRYLRSTGKWNEQKWSKDEFLYNTLFVKK